MRPCDNCAKVDVQGKQAYLLRIVYDADHLYKIYCGNTVSRHCHVEPGDYVSWQLDELAPDDTFTLELKKHKTPLFEGNVTRWVVTKQQPSEPLRIADSATPNTGKCEEPYWYEYNDPDKPITHPGPDIIVCPPGGCH